MKQEMQIILTLEVDVNKSKAEIIKFFTEMEQVYTRTASQTNCMTFSKISLIDIKEEAQIYSNY